MFPPEWRRLLLGVGLDRPDDDMLRITRGEHFYLIGGSRPTHEQMQEVSRRFQDELHKRVKTINELSTQEFSEIMKKLGLNPAPRSLPPKRGGIG
jgi:hypothetical protein